jgi:LysM repeat protein
MNPQGSLLEQKGKKKPNLPVVVFIFLAIHAVVLGGILMSGCKKDDAGTGTTPPGHRPATGGLPPINTNDWLTQPPTPPPVATNVAVITPPAPVASNPPIAISPAPIIPPPSVPIPTQPAPSDTPLGQPTTHVIAKGDSFYSLGLRYKVPMKDIEKANPNVDPKKLKLGQKVNIPAPEPKPAPTGTANGGTKAAEPGTYVVKSGDVLDRIAKANGTTVKAIQEANNLVDTRIKVGQKLKLPAAGNGKKTNGTPPPADPGNPAPPAKNP